MILSADHATAFQQALQIGRREESCHTEGHRWVEKRFAEVVQVDGCGSELKEIEGHAGTLKPDKSLPFDHAFSPEEIRPFSVF